MVQRISSERERNHAEVGDKGQAFGGVRAADAPN
jgi:hypothetical protein